MPLSYRNDPVRTEIHSGTQPFSIVTIALDRDSGKLLKLWLPSSLLREIPDYPGNGSFLDWSGGSAPDVCLVDFDKGAAKAFNIAELIHQDNPEMAIFAVSSDARPEVIIQAMRGGCSEYLFKPLVRDQLLEALIRAGSRRRERKERASAQVLTFVGAKGGCGVTTIATQLGALLAGSKRTFLLDLHPSLGDAGLYLGFASNQCHSYELMQNADRLDAELLQSLVLHHYSGLDVVPSPNDFDSTRHAPTSTIIQTFNVLRPLYDFIIVDPPAGLNEHTAKLLGHSDYLYIVTVAEVSSLRNVSRILEYLAQEEIPDERIRVILNRFEKRSPITDSQIEKVIRRKIFRTVPNQYEHAVRTITTGESKDDLSRSDLMRNLKGWADLIAGPTAQATAASTSANNKKKSGILGLFGGGA